MSPMVSLAGVWKQYKRGRETVPVLSDFNLEIPQGDFVAFMGPSGSGKTTLLNLIGGLDTPTSGSVTVAGERIDQLKGANLTRWRARHIGFVFQFYNLLPTLSAERNVEIPLLLTSLSAADRKRKVAAALALVGLSDRAKHKPTELSGGQQQRVAIARALIADPTLLVCDEPTGDLDRHSAEEILGLIQTLNREYGKTVVMVTHDPKAAEYASRELHFDKGQLDGSVSGPPHEVRRAHLGGYHEEEGPYFTHIPTGRRCVRTLRRTSGVKDRGDEAIVAVPEPISSQCMARAFGALPFVVSRKD